MLDSLGILYDNFVYITYDVHLLISFSVLLEIILRCVTQMSYILSHSFINHALIEYNYDIISILCTIAKFIKRHFSNRRSRCFTLCHVLENRWFKSSHSTLLLMC